MTMATGMAVPAAADIVTFTDRAAFAAAAGGPMDSQSFESFFLPTPSASFPGFTLDETGPGAIPVVYSGNRIFASLAGVSDAITDGRGFAGFVDNGASLVRFRFAAPISAFGLDVTSSAATTVTFGGGVAGSLALAANRPGFFGVIDTAGTFGTVTLSAGGGPFVGVDAVAFGTAPRVTPNPEASTWGMAGLVAVLGLGGLWCRRRSGAG
jgi:hypothetical protein